MNRVGQNHIHTVYIRYFWQENHQIYGHIRGACTVLANPTDTAFHAMLTVAQTVANIAHALLL